MRNALTHCCHHCDWQHTLVLDDGESDLHECFDHCPWCRSPDLLIRRATRLETLAVRVTRPSTTIAYRRHSKLPLKGIDSPYKRRQQNHSISI